MTRIALAWYFHLPSIVSAREVREHAEQSLALLLRAHRKHDAPVLVAPTGSFLSLCQRKAPAVLDELAEAIASGTVTLGATYFHEIDPFVVPFGDVREQLLRDHEIKRALLDATPRWFFTPNFSWHPGLDLLLEELAIGGAILDGRQLAECASARAWHWSGAELGESLIHDVAPDVQPFEHRRLRRAPSRAEGGKGLLVAFRDWPLSRALTFGNESAIDHEDAAARVEDALGALEEQDLVVLADDGDRVRPASRRGYEALLQSAPSPVDWSALARERSPLPPVRELVAYSQPGFEELLRTSLEARAYWSLLQEIAVLPLTAAQRDTYLALQDVFYPFWRGTGRRRWYLDTALKLLTEAGMPRPAPVDVPRALSLREA